MLVSPPGPTLFAFVVQVLLITGIILGVLQLGVVPRVINVVGVIKWARIGSILSVAFLVMIPNASAISWNAPSLFIACVTSVLLFNFAISAVGSNDPSPAEAR